MKKILLIISLILSFSAIVFAQENLYEVKANVKDQENIPLAGLNLYFDDGNKKQTIVTDENGNFIAKLPIGKYVVTANSATSKTFTAYLEIQKDASSNPNNFDLTVELNKEMCQSNKPIEVLNAARPNYPPAARAVGAVGEVVVKVKIDKDGKVISAKSISGHPLLRPVSEKSAQMWFFSSDDLTERECYIVFAFVLSEKGINGKFRKPNRLEIYFEPHLIY